MINSKYCLLILFFSNYIRLSQDINIAGTNELGLFFHIELTKMAYSISKTEDSQNISDVAILILLDISKLQGTRDKTFKIPIGELRIIILIGEITTATEAEWDGNIDKLQGKLKSSTKLVEFFNENEELVQNRKISQPNITYLASNKIYLKATNDFKMYRGSSNSMEIISHLEVDLEAEDIIINYLPKNTIGLYVSEKSRIHVKISMGQFHFTCNMFIKKAVPDTMKILEELSNPKKEVTNEPINVNIIGSNENSDGKVPPEAAGSPENPDASIKPEPKTPSKTPSNEKPFYRKGWFIFVVVALIGCLVFLVVGYYWVMEKRKRYVTKTSRQKKSKLKGI